MARFALEGGAVRLAMSAFELKVDPVAVLIGFLGTLVLAIAAVAPAAWRLARLPIAAALSED